MVTKSENKVIKELRSEGYSVVHSGAPDFLCFKTKKVENPNIEDIDLESIKFIEVKYDNDSLRHEQIIWKYILEKLGLNYKLIHISPENLTGVS